ncbi:peptidase M15D vanX D-ala-D-ala dipeptidase [Chloroherpeton thalassium ATCC 35110]|uniref:D-alanyl-D-alanine dipeptidase n=1 Tax=Chloroherpeton thalassium (strain ATCC 35110 / GB-78) TaxID=517418 RepID=B3QRV0_CHLT3|nr:M15 family metallopeptidase [Chloroherpeton thalassium]ACF13903.1 peptidase M15D vanX D-ala-D-ala dipeptidase [Chloroherpeton thalassium ATCC 35110]
MQLPAILSFFLFFHPHSAPLPPEAVLVDVQKINPYIFVDMRYATKNNFTGEKIYSAARCLLRPKVAKRLSRVAKRLRHKGYGVKVWDAFRPKSAQEKLWNATPPKLRRYVANPKKGSKHTRGVAVDVTLTDTLGRELQMPTPFDTFNIRARSNYENLPKKAIRNRTILHDAMKAEGFLSVSGEWWHFHDAEWRCYPLLDLNFQDVPQ